MGYSGAGVAVGRRQYLGDPLTLSAEAAHCFDTCLKLFGGRRGHRWAAAEPA